jgi:hypothetical protein
MAEAVRSDRGWGGGVEGRGEEGAGGSIAERRGMDGARDCGVGPETCVRGWKGGWAADPRERMEGRTGFFFSSSFFLVVEIVGESLAPTVADLPQTWWKL